MDDPPLDPVYMDKPCEICGEIGYASIIRICCKCKITREHVYCMRIRYEGEEEKWICEDCDRANQISLSKLAPIEQPKDKGTRFNIMKPPQNTKVQYITPEEARVLESGAMKKDTSSQSKVKSTLFPKRDAIRRSNSPPKFSVKPNQQFGPPGFTKPLRDRIKATSALRENKLAARGKVTDVTQKHHACKEAAGATGFPARKSQTSKATPGKETELVRQPLRESPFTTPLPPGSFLRQNAEDNNISSGRLSPQSMQSLPVVSSGNDVLAKSQLRSCDPEGREPLEVKLEFDRYLPNHPAIYPTWMGRFKITSDSLPFGDFDEIRAYPPCKVQRKAYDMSKQLPSALQLQPVPRLSIWLDLFEGDGPCALDIGLYFISTKRPEQSYTALLEFLDAHDMLLRCQIDGVELWVFSSKHLQQDSQRINKSFFLWGLFRLDSALPNASDMTPPPSKRETQVTCPLTKVEANVSLELTSQKRDTSDATEVTHPLTMLPLLDEEDFERELQNSYNRFATLRESFRRGNA